MGRKAYVVNYGTAVYEEDFEGKKIVLEPGEKMLMSRSSALKFKGRYIPPPEGSLTPPPKTIRVDFVPDNEETELFISNLTGEVFQTKKELENHYNANKSNVEDNKEETTTKVYVCPHCEKELGSKAAWKKHIGVHDDTKRDIR